MKAMRYLQRNWEPSGIYDFLFSNFLDVNNSFNREFDFARQQTWRLNRRRLHNGNPATNTYGFGVAKLFRVTSRPLKMQVDNAFLSRALAGREIASNDVRGFAEQCLAFAPVPSPIA